MKHRRSGNLTGIRGVHLVAAKLCKLGLIPSITSRNAKGADILVTNQECIKTYTIQVKTNASTFGFWNISKDFKTMATSRNYIFVLVNIRDKKDGTELVEYYVVPSRVIAEKTLPGPTPKKPGGMGCTWGLY